MDDRSMNPAEGEQNQAAPETPEDVAVLYTWANVHGGKYRDFSAERREHRAQQRHRMVEAQRQAELDAAREREEAAAREIEEARLREQEAADEVARREAEEARRLAEERAIREREAAQRHVETAENLKRALEDAQREMEEARRRVEEQAARYAEADARSRNSSLDLPGQIDDPYYYAGHLEPSAFAPGKGVRSSVPQRVSSERRITENYYRSKEGGEMHSAPTSERDSHGLFASGLRSRASGSRSPYTESSAYRERRIETAEDTRERGRPDELERLHRSADMHERDIDDQGYYDHQMDRKSASSITPAVPHVSSDSHSASHELHIPPRIPSARPSSASGERRVMRSLDPEPGNTHVLDNSRVRRRESATDISARTTRRSRQEPIAHPASDMTEAAGYSADSLNAMRRLPTDRRWSDASLPPTHRDEPARSPEPLRSPEERPEWLERDARISSETTLYREQPTATPIERVIPEERQFVSASDGGFNLPPLPDVLAASQAEARSRESDRREMSPARVSETRRVERTADDRVMRDVQPPRPVAERVVEREVPPPRPASRTSGDTLQQSRERVAARWFALKGLVGGNAEASSESAAPARNKEMAVPTLCVMSLSGGVGKTSMVATIGRTLSSRGERVLLADATPHGLLPYYFGARELRPDVVRTFSPPPDSKDAPVFMVNYEAERLNGDDEGQAALLAEIAQHTRGTQRVLLDLNSSSAWLGRRLAETQQAKILVPITPDMNSVLGMKNMERFFAGAQDVEGRPIRPFYVLNQFDASLPLHLDVREVLRQQLGDRLLPIMIRRSPAVAEALAEGMTVMDYAPESPVAEDYTHLAEWARNLAAPAQNSMRSIRWSER